jgi:hypothetical protein
LARGALSIGGTFEWWGSVLSFEVLSTVKHSNGDRLKIILPSLNG